MATSIFRSWTLVEGLGVSQTFSTPGVLPVNEEFRDLVLANTASYEQVYLLGLRLSHYNFLLQDHAYFQFSWAGGEDVRYAFYPNPFLATPEREAEFRRRRELLESGFVTYEEFAAMVRDEVGGARAPLIRYENAPSQHKGLAHPCSHFHIGYHDDNRWAVDRVLTPYAFTLLVAKQYYGEQWRSTGKDDAESGNKWETELLKEKHNCVPVPPDLLLSVERRSFLFS